MYIYTAHVLEESFSPDSFEIPPPSFASSLAGAFLLRRNIKTFCLSQNNRAPTTKIHPKAGGLGVCHSNFGGHYSSNSSCVSPNIKKAKIVAFTHEVATHTLKNL